MKVEIVIDKTKEEKALIIANENRPSLSKVKEILEEENCIIGYKNETIKKLNLHDVVNIFTDKSKIYVATKDNEFVVKERLYQIEELLDDSFIKINQGCLININEIVEFKVSLGASLKVIMSNGFSDYVSRRELKKVKGKLGL